MKFWIYAVVIFVALGLVGNITTLDGAGAAEALVSGLGMIVLVLLICGIVIMVRFFKQRIRKEP